MAFSVPVLSFEELMDCSICMEIFHDPIALPCMHTFCKNCLQSYITTLNAKRDVTLCGFDCPVCRKETYSPVVGLPVEEWASGFTPNYTVKGLLDEHNKTSHLNEDSKTRQAQADVQVCVVHSSKVAEFKCEDHIPHMLLCALCAAKKHKRCSSLFYLGDDSTFSETEDVELHVNIDPLLPVRKISSRRKEQKGGKIFKETVNDDFGIENDGWIDKNSAQYDISDNPHRSLRRLVNSSRSHSFEECNDLRALSASVSPFDMINSAEDGVLLNNDSSDVRATDPPFDMSVHSRGLTECRLPSSPNDATSTQYESHPSLRRLVRGAVPHSFNEGDDLRRLSAGSKDKKSFEALMPNAEFRSETTPERTREKVKKAMSIIMETTEDETMSCSNNNAQKSLLIDVPFSMRSTLQFSEKIKIRLQEDSKVCSVTGICSMPDGRVLIADFNNCKVKVIGARAGDKTYVTLPSEPWDIDCIGDYEAVVSLPNAMCLFTLVVDENVTVGRRIDVARKCYGVVFNNMRFFIACTSEIKILSYNGEFIMRILRDKKSIFPNPRAQGSNMKYLCLDKMDANKVYVSDHNRGVICVTQTGEILSVHSSSDSTTPLGLTTNQSGIVIVCQAPNRITIFLVNDLGCSTKDVLNIENAQNVDINKADGRLWVSTTDNDMLFIYTIINNNKPRLEIKKKHC